MCTLLPCSAKYLSIAMSSHIDSDACEVLMVQEWFGPSLISLRTQSMLEDVCHILHATGVALGHLNDFLSSVVQTEFEFRVTMPCCAM